MDRQGPSRLGRSLALPHESVAWARRKVGRDRWARRKVGRDRWARRKVGRDRWARRTKQFTKPERPARRSGPTSSWRSWGATIADGA